MLDSHLRDNRTNSTESDERGFRKKHVAAVELRNTKSPPPFETTQKSTEIIKRSPSKESLKVYASPAFIRINRLALDETALNRSPFLRLSPNVKNMGSRKDLVEKVQKEYTTAQKSLKLAMAGESTTYLPQIGKKKKVKKTRRIE